MICKIEIANYRFLFCKSLAYFHFINNRFHKKLTPFQSPELEVRKKKLQNVLELLFINTYCNYFSLFVR